MPVEKRGVTVAVSVILCMAIVVVAATGFYIWYGTFVKGFGSRPMHLLSIALIGPNSGDMGETVVLRLKNTGNIDLANWSLVQGVPDSGTRLEVSGERCIFADLDGLGPWTFIAKAFTGSGTSVQDVWVIEPASVIDQASVTTPDQAIRDIIENDLQPLVDGNPGTPLADKMEDAIAKAETAIQEVEKTPPDNQAAVENIEGAVGDVEAAVEGGLLDPDMGTGIMDKFAEIARYLAEQAIAEAIARNGDESKITEAEQFLGEGDVLRASGSYKDAVDKYNDALEKAEEA